MALITLMFFTFETLIIFSLLYILSIPLACYTYYKNEKQKIEKKIEDEHEDIL